MRSWRRRSPTAFLGDPRLSAGTGRRSASGGRGLMAVAEPRAQSAPTRGREAPSLRRILALGGHDFTSRPPDRAVCELMLRLGDRARWGPAADLHPADRER